MKSFRLHGVTVSLFANTVKVQDRDRIFYKVAMAKTYRDDEGQLQRMSNFDATDIPLLGALLDQAYGTMIEQAMRTGKRESEE